MWVTIIGRGQTVRLLAVGPGSIPTAYPDFFETHSLWRNALLSLGIVERALVLPQSNMLAFIDFPMGKLILSKEWDWRTGGRNGRMLESRNWDSYVK